MSDDLAARYDDILRRTPGLMEILRQARALALPDWLVVSGAVYQPVWNALTDRPLDHGLKDYDLAYFDASDISYEAEDVVIKRAAAVLPPDSVLAKFRTPKPRGGRLAPPAEDTAESTERRNMIDGEAIDLGVTRGAVRHTGKADRDRKKPVPAAPRSPGRATKM